MKKLTGSLFVLFTVLISALFGGDFEKNDDLVKELKKNHIRLVVLCNFQGTNNLLDIVTSSRSPGFELTDYGLAMLNDAASALASQHIAYIYTSSAYRAQQTASLLGKAFYLTPRQILVSNFLEMQNFGSANGEDYDVYKERFSSTKEMLEATPSNGESGLSVFKRSEYFLKNLTNFNHCTILIVTYAFNYCHISKCLTGKYGVIPSPGTFIIYDFNVSNEGFSLGDIYPKDL